MEIIEISDVNSKKVKISFDNGIALVLYKGDLPKYGISLGEYKESDYEELIEVLKKRAVNRCAGILTGRDMTESMLKDKLSSDGYPEDAIEFALERMRKERLVDDERFALMYIEAKSLKKSKNDIIRDLSAKGINPDRALELYEELKADGDVMDETELIMNILNKKHFFDEDRDYESSSKMIQYLLRKGFSYDTIRSAIKGE